MDASPEWECLREATTTRILGQGSEGLLVSSNVADLSITLTPLPDTEVQGARELLHLVCKESLELWGWAGLSTS